MLQLKDQNKAMRERSHFSRIILFFAIIFFFGVNTNSNKLYAQNDGLGLGVIVGEPTGISLKKWLSKKTAFDGAVAWSVSGNNHLYVHGDYLVHSFNVINSRSTYVPVYYGIGGLIRFDDETRLGVRIPFGVSYFVPGSPLDVFLEIAPIMELTPQTELDGSVGIGIRFFF